MSIEDKGKSAEQIGTLGSCLIEGDPEQKARERKIKRRALGISIVLQCATIVALVLVPLLGHTEKITPRIYIPIPPYHHQPAKPIVQRTTAHAPRTGFYPPTSIPPTIAMRDNPPTTPTGPESVDDNEFVNLPGNTDGLGIPDARRNPTPPDDTNRNRTKRLQVGKIEPAMILRRVEPIYPALAKQLRRSGQVHLRAIISTDGVLESLEVIDGDPLLLQSAKDAVLQWKYRPTYLNGQPVEVETIITVVYTLNQ